MSSSVRRISDEQAWRHEFGRRVRAGLTATGITTRRLAEILDLSHSTIGNIKAGRHGTPAYRVAQIAAVLAIQPPGWDMPESTAQQVHRDLVTELARLRAVVTRMRRTLHDDDTTPPVNEPAQPRRSKVSE